MSKRKAQALALSAALLVCGIATILPFLWMLASSFKSNAEISALNQRFLPLEPSLINYRNALQKMNFLRYFANSLVYAVLLTAITILRSTPAQSAALCFANTASVEGSCSLALFWPR